MEKLWQRARLLHDQLYDVHKQLPSSYKPSNPVAASSRSFYSLTGPKPVRIYFQNILLAIQWKELQDSRIARASAPNAFPSYSIDAPVVGPQVHHVCIGPVTEK